MIFYLIILTRTLFHNCMWSLFYDLWKRSWIILRSDKYQTLEGIHHNHYELLVSLFKKIFLILFSLHFNKYKFILNLFFISWLFLNWLWFKVVKLYYQKSFIWRWFDQFLCFFRFYILRINTPTKFNIL